MGMGNVGKLRDKRGGTKATAAAKLTSMTTKTIWFTPENKVLNRDKDNDNDNGSEPDLNNATSH